MKKLKIFSLAFPAASLYVANSNISSIGLTPYAFSVDVFDNRILQLDTWVVLKYNYDGNGSIGTYSCAELSLLLHAWKRMDFPHQYRSKGEVVLKYAIMNESLYLPRASKFTPYSFQNRNFKFFKENIFRV